MSYCRFSDNDFQCDIYAYESDSGYVIHTASKKYIITDPIPEHVSIDDTEKWIERYYVVDAIIEKSELVDIDLPYAGETFVFDEFSEFVDQLELLRKIGYRLPEASLLEET